MKLKALIFFFTISSLTSYSFAQIVFKCFHKEYTVPSFRYDTISKNYAEKQFEELKILYPIQNSVFSIELRGYYYVVNPFMGSVVIIKGNENTLFAEAWYYHVQRDLTDTIAPVGFKIVKWAKRNVYFSKKTLPISDTLLTALIKNGLFSKPGAFAIMDSLKKRHVNVNGIRAFDPYFITFELKVNEHYIGGYCNPFTWSANKEIEELVNEKKLFDLFNDIYVKSGQEPNHLFP